MELGSLFFCLFGIFSSPRCWKGFGAGWIQGKEVDGNVN